MSHRKHRSILTMIDFAIRYSFAIMMMSLKTVDMSGGTGEYLSWSRGIPREILNRGYIEFK